MANNGSASMELGVTYYSFDNGIGVRVISGSTAGTLNVRAWDNLEDGEPEYNFVTDAFDLKALGLEGLRQMDADQFARFLYKMATWSRI